MSIKNPHDKFFKEIFSDKEKAKELITLALPKNITEYFLWNDFTVEKDSFINKEMREFHSDILFSIKLKNNESVKIYLLFEHKSFLDTSLYLQLLNYLVGIYNKHKKIVPVIPIVFYHGKSVFKETDLFSEINSNEMRNYLLKFVPLFNYELIDLQKNDVEDMIISLTMKVLLYTFKNIRDFEDSNILEKFILLSKDLFFEESGLKIIEKMIMYLFSVNEVNPSDIKNSIVKFISEEKGDSIMATTAERLINQGLEQGIGKGAEITNIEIAKKMISEGLDLKMISRITGLSKEQIDKLKLKS